MTAARPWGEVKSFLANGNVLDDLEASFSPERMGTYLRDVQGDRKKALHLYTWNTAISAAFYEPLQGLEVALRNAMHRQLAGCYGAAWYNNPAAGLDRGVSCSDCRRENRCSARQPYSGAISDCSCALLWLLDFAAWLRRSHQSGWTQGEL